MSVNNLLVISDTHCGCQLGLCPPEFDFALLDEGGGYRLSRMQEVLWSWWLEMQTEWVPRVTKGEPFILLHNGDVVDGVHHNSTTQITHNIGDQAKIAVAALAPLIARAERYYHVRGTEAHVGSSGVEENRIAKELGAVPNEIGQYARHDVWIDLGVNKSRMIHALHHIGTTSSAANEATALHKEMVEEFVEACRWGDRRPDGIVRSHRHTHFETRFSTVDGAAPCVITPGWQLKTPFVWRTARGRLAPPQLGAVLFRVDPDDGKLFTQEFVRHIGRSECVR